jgi:ubiquitin C-terminal hydrolase
VYVVGVDCLGSWRGRFNLGNTCYMNSAMQGLSHTLILTNYFLSRRFLQDINVDNPLGHKGRFSFPFSVFFFLFLLLLLLLFLLLFCYYYLLLLLLFFFFFLLLLLLFFCCYYYNFQYIILFLPLSFPGNRLAAQLHFLLSDLWNQNTKSVIDPSSFHNAICDAFPNFSGSMMQKHEECD